MDFPEHEDPQEMECTSCNMQMEIERRQCGPHVGAYCKLCGTKIRHLKKLKNLNRRPAKNNDGLLKDKYSRGFAFCSICYRSSTQILEKTGLKLEIHHIKEVQHGGDNTPENLLCVCCDCHKLLHSIRYITHRNLTTWQK